MAETLNSWPATAGKAEKTLEMDVVSEVCLGASRRVVQENPVCLRRLAEIASGPDSMEYLLQRIWFQDLIHHWFQQQAWVRHVQQNSPKRSRKNSGPCPHGPRCQICLGETPAVRKLKRLVDVSRNKICRRLRSCLLLYRLRQCLILYEEN